MGLSAIIKTTMSFYTELRRRNVLKVAAVYVVGSWLLIRLIHNMHPVLGIPHWSERLIGLLLIIGLPLARHPRAGTDQAGQHRARPDRRAEPKLPTPR